MYTICDWDGANDTSVTFTRGNNNIIINTNIVD